MTIIKYQTVKDVEEYFNQLDSKGFKHIIYFPTEKDDWKSLATLTAEFKKEIEDQWEKHDFSLLECSEELRKDSQFICTVVQYFPREYKNIHPSILSNTEETDDFLGWWYDKIVAYYNIGMKPAERWTKWFLGLTPDDTWYYSWKLSLKEGKFSDLPKKLQTKEFLIQALKTRSYTANNFTTFDSKTNRIIAINEFKDDKELSELILDSFYKDNRYHTRPVDNK
jgi:hypothetical protein